MSRSIFKFYDILLIITVCSFVIVGRSPAYSGQGPAYSGVLRPYVGPMH